MQDQNTVCAFVNILLIFQRMPRWSTRHFMCDCGYWFSWLVPRDL